MKLSTHRRRLNAVNEPIQDVPKVSSVKRNMGSEFSRMIKEAKLLGMALGIPCLDGIEEAEAQCALLNSETFMCEGGYVVCYKMDDIETKLGFLLPSFLASDYNQRIRGFRPDSACKIVKSYSDSAVLQRLASEDLASLKKEKVCKKKDQIFISANKEHVAPHLGNSDRSDSDLQLTRNHFESVINAYLKPR